MTGQATYLWIVEWEDRFVRPQRAEVRTVTRVPGTSDEELERQLIDVEIPLLAREQTRVGGVARQSLLRLSGERTQTTGFGNAREGVAHAVGTTGVATALNADVVWSSDAPVDELA